MQIKGKKIHFLGDSITKGHGLAKESSVYWRLLEAKDGAIVRGYGISGTRIAKQRIPSEDLLQDQYFGSRVADMEADADVIVVFGGTNDFGHGDAPFGTMNDRTDDTFCGAFHKLCISLIEKYPEAQLVILTPLHRWDEDHAINNHDLRRAALLKDYVDAIIEIAGYYSIPVLDLYRVSGIQPAVPILREKYLPDGLHPNEEGHMLVYRKLKHFLEML